MFNIILTGIIIGILVSAPTGPLGVLCIQRTLHKGRLNGIITGLGATTSDLVYAVLVGFSMNFIINFVNEYKFIIQIVGSVILFIFGYYIFKKKPKTAPSNDEERGKTNRNLFSTYTSAFGLCFSNPIIIFFFIALFARFNFFSPEYSIFQVIISLASILAGAFLWWVFLTLIVGIFRGKFKEKGLKILNFITGGILMVIAVAGVILGLLENFKN
ncbi:MAG: LysE family translocator [Prevotellaceae bacterium]|jgi:threonine/homoserine/homoserine lactone efflux protein|nr:LysE family translocator [Prevotellaceae bacterium]